VSALVWEAKPIPPAVTVLPLLMAERLLPDRRDGAAPAIAVPGDLDTGSPGMRALAALCSDDDPQPTDETPFHLPSLRRPGRAVHLRYAVLLAVCVLAAQFCAEALHGARGYWLPMTVPSSTSPTSGPFSAGPCTAVSARWSAWPPSAPSTW
jgi:hypothetical protein